MDETARVLALDLGCLSPADIEWLHELKNRATVMTGRLQLKHAKENKPMDDKYGSLLREKMKESMSRPASEWKPTNRREPIDDPRITAGLLILMIVLAIAAATMPLWWPLP